MTQRETPPEDAQAQASLPERQIAIAAAEYLLRSMLPALDRRQSGAVDTGGQSVFDAGCAALSGLGVMEPTRRPSIWRLRPGLSDARAQLDALRELSKGQVASCFQAFLNHAAGHERSLPDTRAGFEVPAAHAGICRALLASGYLLRDGGRVMWSEKVAPFMQEAVLWDSRGQCLSEIYEAQEEAEARQFLAALPAHLAAKLRTTIRERSGLAGIDLLKRHWTAAGWSELPQAQPGDLTEAGFRIAVYTCVVRMVREGRI